MPELYIIDKNTLKPLHMEESFSSLVWTERYQSHGDFVLTIPLKKVNLDYYVRGNIVMLSDGTQPMLIESIETEENIEDPYVEVGGRSLTCFLERRINASKAADVQKNAIQYNGELSSVVASIVHDEMIDPIMPYYYWYHLKNGEIEEGYDQSSPSSNKKGIKKESASYRIFPNFSYENVNVQGTINRNFDKLMTVYELLVSVSKQLISGFRVIIKNGKYVLETYKGTDRSSNQSDNDPMYFDKIMDNVVYTNFYEDQTDYKNVALAYSDSPISDVDINYGSISSYIYNGYSWVYKKEDNEKFSGIDRFELAVDARSSASVSSILESDDGSSAAANAQVSSVAETEFDTGNYDFVSLTEGEIDPLAQYVFGEDYFLGDIVEISNSFGTVLTSVIDEVVRSYDSEGYIVTPNFCNMDDYDYGDEDV